MVVIMKLNSKCFSFPQMVGPYTFSIPENCLEKADMDALLTDPFVSHTCNSKFGSSTPVPSVQFSGKREDFFSAKRYMLNYVDEHEKKHHSVSSQPQQQPQPQEQHHPEVITKDLDSKVVEALQALMKEDFSKVEVEQTSGDRVKISCHGPTAQDIMNRIDLLRQEEVPLTDSDLEKIKQPMDTTAEGVTAYWLPVHDKGKVVIFCFDYNAVSKAKYLLNVKLGKFKVTARARRRFDGKKTETDSGSISQSHPHSLGYESSQPAVTGGAKDFTTKSGIRVSVYKTDITKLPVDAIVNVANEHLSHGGGVAYAIAKAAGFSLESEGEDYIQRNGPLKVTEVVVTTAGSLPCKKVLHAVGPRWSDYKDKTLCQQHLADTVYNCLHKANSMQIASLAVPSISSGK